jgi:hypothetical protein
MAATAKKAGAVRKSPARKVATESQDSEAVNLFEGLPTPKAAAAQAFPSPYPKDVKVWTYQPDDEKAAPILLPLSGFSPGDKLWHFDLAQLPILAQTWKWMERANVPKGIQRQAQMLSDAEYFKMFNAWFEVIKVAQAPKGAVTAGK